MNLYHVQDTERAMHVVAESFADAVVRWKAQIVRENPESDCEDDQPQGVSLLAEGSDVDKYPELLLPEAKP